MRDEEYEKIKGYTDLLNRQLIAEEASKIKAGGTIVEVGSYCGRSTLCFAENSNPLVSIYCVDTWDCRAMDNVAPEDTFNEFRTNLQSYWSRIIPIRGDSDSIGRAWTREIDLLFLDADHSEEATLQDLTNFVPHIVDGGVLLMHDYDRDAVAGALQKFMNKNRDIESRETINKMLRAKVIHRNES